MKTDVAPSAKQKGRKTQGERKQKKSGERKKRYARRKQKLVLLCESSMSNAKESDVI